MEVGQEDDQAEVDTSVQDLHNSSYHYIPVQPA